MERWVKLAHDIWFFLPKGEVKHRLIIVDEQWIFHKGNVSKHCNRGWPSSVDHPLDHPQEQRMIIFCSWKIIFKNIIFAKRFQRWEDVCHWDSYQDCTKVVAKAPSLWSSCGKIFVIDTYVFSTLETFPQQVVCSWKFSLHKEHYQMFALIHEWTTQQLVRKTCPISQTNRRKRRGIYLSTHNSF